MTVEVRFMLAPDADPRPDAVGEPVPVPRQATPLSAGLDLLAWVPAPCVIPPGRWARVPTGMCVEIPPGFEGQVRPRSGLAAHHGITVLNAPGTVDADYRGQVQVLLVNLSDRPYTVNRGDRVAQMVICPVAHPVTVSVVAALGATGRGAGGFGSTGV